EHDDRRAGARDVLAELQLGRSLRLVAGEVHHVRPDAQLADVVLHGDAAVRGARPRRGESEKAEKRGAAQPASAKQRCRHNAVKFGIAGPLTSLTVLFPCGSKKNSSAP